MIHTVKGFGVVNEAEVDVLLELSCFLDDPLVTSNSLILVFHFFYMPNQILRFLEGVYTG